MENIFSSIKREEDFSRFVLFSLISHIFMIVLVCIFYNSQGVSTREFTLQDTQAFIQALEEIKEEEFPDMDIDEWDTSLTISNQEFFKIFEGVRIPDLKLNEKKKIEFYKKLIKAYMDLEDEDKAVLDWELFQKRFLELFKKTDNLQLNYGGKIYSSKVYSDTKKDFLFLPQHKISTLNRLRRFENVERKQTTVSGGRIRVETKEGIKEIPEPYYFRESPYEEMMAQGAELFFIARGFPTLKENESLEESKGENRKQMEAKFNKLSQDFNVVYLYDSSSSQTFSEKQPWKNREALNISTASMKEHLNEWMELKEDEQFFFFKRHYLDRYHPDQGDLAKFLREFIYTNQSNIIIVVDEITGAFAFLEELYFNKPMDTYLVDYWKEFTNTKTGVEILFCLASFYDFERRGLTYLFDAYNKAKEVISKKYYKMDAFNKKAKAFVVKEVYEELIPVLMDNGYQTEKEILEKYFQEEEKIYQMIIDLGDPYRDRALYSWGRLYWDNKNYDLALEKWTKISDSYLSKVFDDIREVLKFSNKKTYMASRINNIFTRESNQDNKQLLDRLLKYRRWAKRSGID